MNARNFALVLLSTTIFGFLPGRAAVAGVITLDNSLIQTTQQDHNGILEVPPEGVNISKGTILSSGSLTIEDSSLGQGLVKGILTVQGTADAKPTLNVEFLGKAPTTTRQDGVLDYSKWDDANVTGWTNLLSDLASADYAAIQAQNANLNISESIFANSKNTSESSFGGAVYVGAGAKLVSEHNFYFNNQAATEGGAVIVGNQAASGNTFTDDYFVKNKSSKSGGAIAVSENVEKIERSIFGENSADIMGGAVSVKEGKTLGSVSHSWFEKNTAGNSGGAIQNNGIINAIDSQSKFDANTAKNGGAVYNSSTGKIGSISNTIFTGNKAEGVDGSRGGAIYNAGTIDKIDNSLFTGNSANLGGALYLDSNASATVANSTFSGNTATGVSGQPDLSGGGAVFANQGAHLTTSGNTFEGNKIESWESMGGAAVQNDNGTWESTNDTFTGNTSQTDGGAIVNNGDTTLTGAAITNNTAVSGSGGGILARSSAVDFSVLNINGGTISNNTAGKQGGGVANLKRGDDYPFNSTVNISGTEISNNKAEEGAGVYNGVEQKMTISGKARLSGNQAKEGGAIYNAGELVIQGKEVALSGNTADVGANLYNNEKGTLTVSGAEDDIDLNYQPFAENGAALPQPQHTLFDQTQDIYNAGTFNITNSSLQLHQGINAGTGGFLANAGAEERRKGTINISDSTVDLGGSGVDGAGVMYGDVVNINPNTIIKTHISTEGDNLNGKISAHDINVSEDNTTLGVVVGVGELQKGESREYQILEGDTVNGHFQNMKENRSYDIKDLGNGKYQISRRGGSFDCPGCDANEQNTNDGWLDRPFDENQNSEAKDIQDKLNNAAQFGNSAQREALDGLAPDVSPLVQAHATEITQRLSSVVSERFYESMDRTGYVHRGKRFYRFPRHESNLWVQGLYGKSKYDVRKGWDMDNEGVSAGFDGHVSDAVQLGVAYAYTKSNGDSVQRETDIKSHTGMIYGNYNPNRFYANWLAMYTRSKYDEEKHVFDHTVKADYDVDAVGAQLMLGRKVGPYVSGDWATGVIKPEIGARYIYTKQHSYTDSIGQSVGSADGHTLTGILGAQYTIGYSLSPTVSWYPEFRAALTYDFVEPSTKTRVDLMSGSAYEVKNENMDRFGIEVGAKIGLDINRQAEIALEYEGLFKGDYTNHTGLANLKYKF